MPIPLPGGASETRTILQFLLMPLVAAVWWILFGEDQADRKADRLVNRDLDLWPFFCGLVLIYVILLLVATHGFRFNPLHS